MIKVAANESVRNVAKDALAGLQLLPNSVFFGVNGAGKSTVCEVLSQAAILEDASQGANESLEVFSFDDKWRRENVGEFVEGGAAESVVTVKLHEDAKDLENKIREAEAKWESADGQVRQKELSKLAVENRQKKIVDAVANGERKKLEKSCPSLSGQRFKRPAIRELLEKGTHSVLGKEEVDERLRIAGSESSGVLPQLPTLPAEWSFSDDLWDEVTADLSENQAVIEVISDWARKGMEMHGAGDSCQFCAGTVTASRLEVLSNAIQQAEKEASSLVKEELTKCQNAALRFRRFKDQLESIDLSSSIYGADLRGRKAEAVVELDSLLEDLQGVEEILSERVKNPRSSVESTKPEIRFSQVNNKYDLLEQRHAEATQQIADHTLNQVKAVDQLKSHCCAKDGAAWSSEADNLVQAEKELEKAKSDRDEISDLLDDLRRDVSTTEATATFLDTNLGLILGEKTLRVSEGKQGEGYLITRHDKRADGMSEGEKKLVSLLYFCAEFLSEDRKQILKNSVVIFDDLGSELDEPRLLAVDRFISNHFQNPRPAALAYFTHSHTYLKILQSRLGDKAFESRRGVEIKPPTAVFYEVYKDSFSGSNQSTRCREWDEEAIKLTNDYWLSFYMVLRAFEDLQDDTVPSLGTGNFCRKVLEGFTEFRAPGNDKFGSRIDEILSANELSLSPALSKVVNGLSHSDLNKNGGVFSRNEVEHAVVQTLELLRAVDEDHFRALLKKFRGRTGAKRIEEALRRRTGMG